MAATPSTMLTLGTKASDFVLPDAVSGKEFSLSTLKGEKATVVMFICNHCPYVKHVNKELVRLYDDYINRGVAFIAISSNDVENYPEDSFNKMEETARLVGYRFPYLYDESQEVAKKYEAACTPDFYVFDEYLKLAYRGQLDDSRPGNSVPVTGIDIRKALEALLNGIDVPSLQKPSIGCNIKWKK